MERLRLKWVELHIAVAFIVGRLSGRTSSKTGYVKYFRPFLDQEKCCDSEEYTTFFPHGLKLVVAFTEHAVDRGRPLTFALPDPVVQTRLYLLRGCP